MTTIIECPIAACPWTLAADAPTVRASALADVFGVGMMTLVSAQGHAEKIERELSDHFGTHRLEEWVAEITRLKDEVAGRRDNSTRASVDGIHGELLAASVSCSAWLAEHEGGDESQRHVVWSVHQGLLGYLLLVRALMDARRVS